MSETATSGISAARRIGTVTALIVLLLDQATKVFVYVGLDIATNAPIRVLPFFDLTLVWNYGISYGLFQQSTQAGRWALFAFKIVAAVALTIWFWRAGEKLLSLALGLIVGGAIGNAIDRAVYGAVLDFAHLHYGTFSWYVFNVADAAIVVGVLFLLYDSFRPLPRRAPESP
jgi:signal peptidase II